MSTTHDAVIRALRPTVIAIATDRTGQEKSNTVGNPRFTTGEGARIYQRVPVTVRDEPTVYKNELHRAKMRKTPSGQQVF